MTEHKKVTGVVSRKWGKNAISLNLGGYGNNMSLSQYGGLDTDVEEGDKIEVAYTEREKDGKVYNNIVAGSIVVLNKSPKDVTQNYGQAVVGHVPKGKICETMLDRDTLIVRQSCLKAAVEFKLNSMGDAPMTTSQLLKLAEEFERWVNRQ